VSFSVDAYDVQIEDAVARLDVNRIGRECFVTKAPEICALITRDAASGRAVRILDTFLNVAQARTRGIDFEAIVRQEVDFIGAQDENVSLRWLVGRTFERSDTAPNPPAPAPAAIPRDSAGYLGMPDLSSNLTATYGVGPWSFQLQSQFVDAVKRNIDWIEGIHIDDETISSMTWFNGRIGYSGEMESGSTWSVGFNIQNILDREPPIFGGTNNTYDQYGRRYNLNFNYSL
jgi:iron complex outermembrane receptor protein